VPSVNLINVSKTSEDNVGRSGSTPDPSSIPLEDLSPVPPSSVYNPNHLSQDLAERLSIVSYPVNDQDVVRRVRNQVVSSLV
jgi:hypothetical protein